MHCASVLLTVWRLTGLVYTARDVIVRECPRMRCSGHDVV
jgi:hypothetical protein